MSYKRIGDYWSEIDDFKNQTKEMQREIVDAILAERAKSGYQYIYAAKDVINHVDAKTALELCIGMPTVSNYYFKEENVASIALGAAQHEENIEPIIAYLKNINKEMCKRIILGIKNISLDDEEAGLRSLSKIVCPPTFLLKTNYRPTIEALKRLPTVMRLEALECLLNVTLLSYNIFANIPGAEEFKELLFSATVKYNERTEKVWQKYNDVVKMGIPGSLIVKTNCPMCGEFAVEIRSKVVHSEATIKKSRLSNLIRQWCCVCGAFLENPVQIISTIEE